MNASVPSTPLTAGAGAAGTGNLWKKSRTELTIGEDHNV